MATSSSGSTASTSLQFLLRGGEVPAKTPPAILGGSHRSATTEADPFISAVKVEAVYELVSPGRSDAGTDTMASAEPGRLLALEAEDGTTLFLRADKLEEDLLRLYPDARKDGAIDLGVLHDREGASRGVVGEWVWSKLSVLSLEADGLVGEALEFAGDFAKDQLGEQLSKNFRDELEKGVSWLAAKALMRAVESRLGGEPGLYRWRGGEIGKADRILIKNTALEATVRDKTEDSQPILLFIHGTASSTMGSFKDLASPDAKSLWASLQRQFGEHIYGFEHRTFSESPIENVLQLAEILPAKARLSIVTHSRGGLVGDLLCMDKLNEAQINHYQRHNLTNSGDADKQQALAGLEALEHQQLRELSKLLEDKQFRIERYVRVACPAGGTTLLSDNLEVFLSSLLSLMNMLVGPFSGGLGSAMLSAFKRIVLEIANKRIDPHLVPGIEAMLTDAPMGALLANAPRRAGVHMAVIAGDARGRWLKRIAVMFTDWMFFDNANNDMVVDTLSMFTGQAHHPGTYALLDQEQAQEYDHGHRVSHFAYFRNTRTRDALGAWLTCGISEGRMQQTHFRPIREAQVQALQDRSAKPRLDKPSGKRPVVIYLPGIMGSHLDIQGDRVWLDYLELGGGGLERIRVERKNVVPAAMIEGFYGRLAQFLGETFDVIDFPYDWRNSIEEAAKRLEEKLKEALDTASDQPVHLLAHSMGGLVVRAMLATQQLPSSERDLWTEVVKRDGHFVMLGTPNNGSHLMVGTLLGKAGTIRKLAMLDMLRGLQGTLDIVGGYIGALQLLPRPGFFDTRENETEHYDYFDPARWGHLKDRNRDRWFGDKVGATPSRASLDSACQVWTTLLGDKDGKPRKLPHQKHIAYVYGKAEQTDCGIEEQADGGLLMLATGQGDGSVTWESGKLPWLADERYWYMPVEHGALANTEAHFTAIRDLLGTGTTARLGRLPQRRGDAKDTLRKYAVGPEVYPSEEALLSSIYGGMPDYHATTDERYRLVISVRAMDLRFAQLPVMCGHYQGEAITGTERQIDDYIVNGELGKRERLNVYADTVGTSTVILKPRTHEEIERGTGRGAVIVGLGYWSEKISTQQLSDGVVDGVLNFLLHHAERLEREAATRQTANPASRQAAPQASGDTAVELSSLLIGYNSSGHIGIEASIEAIVNGVCEANQRFARNTNSKLHVGKLEFIELYQDTAITAAYTVLGLPKRLGRAFERYGVQVETSQQLEVGRGMCSRLGVNNQTGVWPRLVVTEDERELEPEPGQGLAQRKQRRLPAAFKYAFLSERARSEEIVHQRQPDLLERLVETSVGNYKFDPKIARTLFQLMIPLHLKGIARQAERLLVVVDAHTANLPWEMLQADEKPLVLQVALVRQLVTKRFRQGVSNTVQRWACVIGNPSTEGYFRYFYGKETVPREGALPSLAGAVQEARTISAILRDTPQEYQVEPVYVEDSTTQANSPSAIEVLNALFERPYRILAIAAHGVVDEMHKDGQKRTGVVLSDGLLLTAAEIGQMEVVPELVFLNCCHLGVTTTGQDGKALPAGRYNRLAYSLAQELIEMGVRCVVAAGWAVDDAAASTFAETFFTAFVNEQQAFGDAIHVARRKTYESHGDCNTWGAYQAYGDPNYVLDENLDKHGASCQWSPVSPDELLDKLRRLLMDSNYHKQFSDMEAKVAELLKRSPPEWQDLSSVQCVLGELYAEYAPAPEAFTRALEAYGRAISSEDATGRVPFKVLEQLANLEARMAGEATTDTFGLIDNAINRLTGLLEVTEGFVAVTDGVVKQVPVVRGQGHAPNAERWSLLGSAWKRKASLLPTGKAGWPAVKQALKNSRTAYHHANGGGGVDQPGCSLYALINRLQLEGLLAVDEGKQERDVALQQARRCQELARLRFSRSYDFFDAVMPADAQVAVYLLDGTLASHTAKDLVKLYRDAADSVPSSSRQFDSVTKQLRLLAVFLGTRQAEGDAKCVRRLLDAAEQLMQG